MKSKSPLVSIGMPVYNGEKYIRQALDSLMSQTYKNFELIISDNASTDETRKICEEYAKRDKRIKYMQQKENTGDTNNFKFVLEQATGEYFMWASHDDLWEPTCISELCSLLSSVPSAVLAMSGIVCINAEGAPYAVRTEFINTKGMPYFERISTVLYTCPPDYLYGLFRTAALSEILSAKLFLPNHDIKDYTLLLLRGHAILWLTSSRGDIVASPKLLFSKRNHPNASDSRVESLKVRSLFLYFINTCRCYDFHRMSFRQQLLTMMLAARICMQIYNVYYWHPKSRPLMFAKGVLALLAHTFYRRLIATGISSSSSAPMSISGQVKQCIKSLDQDKRSNLISLLSPHARALQGQAKSERDFLERLEIDPSSVKLSDLLIASFLASDREKAEYYFSRVMDIKVVDEVTNGALDIILDSRVKDFYLDWEAGFNRKSFLSCPSHELHPARNILREEITRYAEFAILEIGFGHGREYEVLRSRNPHVQYVGIDYTPSFVEQAKAAYPEVDFRQGDIRDLSTFTDNSFDLVFSAHLLEHLWGTEECLQALDEMIRVSRDLVLYLWFIPPAIDADEVKTTLVPTMNERGETKDFRENSYPERFIIEHLRGRQLFFKKTEIMEAKDGKVEQLYYIQKTIEETPLEAIRILPGYCATVPVNVWIKL